LTKLFHRNALETLGAFLIFFGILIFLFPDVTLGENVFIRRDMARFWLPMWSFSIQTLQEGSLPLWNPWVFCGTSFFANMQTCVFYPMTVIFHILGVVDGMGWFVVTHLALAGFFTFIWMRGWGVGFGGSFFAGVAYALSGFTLSTINVIIALSAITYFPLVLYCFRKVMNGGGIKWIFFTVMSLSVMFLAGEPMITYATVLVIMTFSLLKFAERTIQTGSLHLHYLVRPLVCVALLASVLAFQIIPFLEKVSFTNRTIMTMEHAMVWSVPVHHLMGLVIPYIADLNLMHLNYWERQSWAEHYYMGMVLMIFCGVAVARWRDRRFQWLVLLMLFALALTLGRHTFLYPLFYYFVPFASLMRYPVKFFFLLSFALACMGGLGLDQVLKREPGAGKTVRPKVYLYGAFFIALFFLCLYTATPLHDSLSRIQEWASSIFMSSENAPDEISNFKELVRIASLNVYRALILAIGTLFLIYLVTANRVTSLLGASIFSLLLIFDLSTANRGFEPTLSRAQYLEPTPNIRKLKNDPSLFRVTAAPPIAWLALKPPEKESATRLHAGKDRLIANTLMHHKIQTFFGYDSFEPKDFVQFNDKLKRLKDPATTRLLDIANVKYIVSGVGVEQASQKFQLVNESPVVNLYENKSVLPRAFLVERAQGLRDNGEILKMIGSAVFQPEETVYVLTRGESGLVENPFLGAEGSSEESGTFSESVVFQRYANQEVELKIHAREAKWLYFADAYEKNWRAEVNGRPVTLYKANVMFRAVPVPAGESEVRFYYKPVLFYVGSAISFITLFGMALFWVYSRRKRLSNSVNST